MERTALNTKVKALVKIKEAQDQQDEDDRKVVFGNQPMKMDLYYIIENLDDLDIKAENFKLSKNQYLDALRAVTKSKV
jgi:hypothetical protein